MRVNKVKVFSGRSIYCHRPCIRLDVDLQGYSEISSKCIGNFNERLINMIPQLKEHRCGIDEDEGFLKKLKEGTYLAHICEHIILALQNILGIDVSYGKSREIEGDAYYIIFEYLYPHSAVEISKLAVDIINALVDNKHINYNERIVIAKKILQNEQMGPSTKAICDAALDAGLPIIKLGEGNYYQIGYGTSGKIIESSIVSSTSCVAVDIACDKLLTKELLKIQNIPVPRGEKIYNIANLIEVGKKIGYPLVLKPQYGNKGNNVVLNIRNKKELISSYEHVRKSVKDIILEQYLEGNDYRVCVINYKVLAVCLRRPPTIEGDGKSTVLQLIRNLNSNSLRGEAHEKPLTKVKINDEVIDYLKCQEVTLKDILPIGRKVYLRRNSNLSTGGEAEDYTDLICDENKDLCVRVSKIIGLDICGIDICCRDISIPIKDNGGIVEVNASPGLRMHMNPSVGISRDVGREIIKLLYGPQIRNIPVISITGTNGKTTTTRLINYTLSKMGYKVGMANSEGVYLDNICIHEGDDSGYESAKSILLNKEVEIAVLETARGGIIKKGLAYDLADIAVITNIAEDHLGNNGIDTMEELCYVKSLIAESVKEDGHVVLNAEDKWTLAIIPRVKSEIVYFSKTKDNNLILNTIKENGIAVYLEEDSIIAFNKGRYYTICRCDEIPITLGGKLSFNIENALAASAALISMKVDYCMIKNGLQSYMLNTKENKGRFNFYDIDGINVILDYAHNENGYEAVLSSVRKIAKGKTIGVIGVPGDRSDKVAREIGRISASYLDNIIIKEDFSKRGRKIGEIAELILMGVKENKKSPKVKILLDELEAFKIALMEAQYGDTVIVFFERLDPLIQFLKLKTDKISSDNLKINLL